MMTVENFNSAASRLPTLTRCRSVCCITQALRRSASYDVAILSYNTALELGYKDKAKCLNERGMCYGALHQHVHALADYDAAIAAAGHREGSERALYWFNRGNAALALGESEAALSNLRTAVELHPSFMQAQNALRTLTASMTMTEPEPDAEPEPRFPDSTDLAEQRPGDSENARRGETTTQKVAGHAAPMGAGGAGAPTSEASADGARRSTVEGALAEALASAQAELASSRAAVAARDAQLAEAHAEIAQLRQQAARAADRRACLHVLRLLALRLHPSFFFFCSTRARVWLCWMAACSVVAVLEGVCLSRRRLCWRVSCLLGSGAARLSCWLPSHVATLARQARDGARRADRSPRGGRGGRD